MYFPGKSEPLTVNESPSSRRSSPKFLPSALELKLASLTERRRSHDASSVSPPAAEVAADAEQRGQQGTSAGQRDQQHAQVHLAPLAGVPAVTATRRLTGARLRVALAAVAALRAARVLACVDGEDGNTVS